MEAGKLSKTSLNVLQVLHRDYGKLAKLERKEDRKNTGGTECLLFTHFLHSLFSGKDRDLKIQRQRVLYRVLTKIICLLHESIPKQYENIFLKFYEEIGIKVTLVAVDVVPYKKLDINNTSSNTNVCDAFVQEDNVFQCTNINLTYNFSDDICKKLRLKGLSLNANLSDIFYISSIKRERGTSYPFSRNPNFSVSVSF